MSDGDNDDFGRRLRDAIPEPRPGYWAAIHANLAQIEAEEDFDENPDTDSGLIRRTDMTNTNPPTNSPRSNRSTVFAAAAALLLIVGLGAAALFYRGNDNDDVSEVDVAAQPDGDPSPSAPPTNSGDAAPTAPATASVTGVTFGDAESPVGGTVKKVTLSGPETSVMVRCDQGGFEPFVFTDQGTWVGCQLPLDTTAGTESTLTEPVFGAVPSPVGGTVGQITIPGPQSSVILECIGDFTPFLFTDQGTWVGCQSAAPSDPAPTPLPTPAPSGPEQDAVGGVVFGDAPSPVGGTVKKATLSGPETSMMVVCDQMPFEPFLFTDQGTWVGCQLPAGGIAGGESALDESVLTEAAGPVGGLVAQLVIPGPQESVMVECAGGFTPFLFEDQGTWIGCQST